jgi:hypothetical protein
MSREITGVKERKQRDAVIADIGTKNSVEFCRKS